MLCNAYRAICLRCKALFRGIRGGKNTILPKIKEKGAFFAPKLCNCGII